MLGSFVTLESEAAGQIRLDLRLQDAATGEIVASLSESGTNPSEIVTRAGVRLRSKLGLAEVSPAEASEARAALPSNPDTARLYAQGLAKLQVFDALAARDILQKAIATEPSYALAHSALAEAWQRLGYDAKANEEAKRAVDLSTNLSREDRLSVEARFHEMSGDWDQAIELYRSLWRGSPDDLEYGLRLASAQYSASKGKDALATLKKLATLPPPGRDDPRIDLKRAYAADVLGDFKLEQTSAERAVDESRARGMNLVMAEARMARATALVHQGRLAEAQSTFEQARETFQHGGDKGRLAMSLSNIGAALQEKGDLESAKRMYQQALDIYNDIGNRRGVALPLNNMAAVLQQEGHLSSALRMYQQALEVDQETGYKIDEAVDRNNIAEVLQSQGDLVGARRMYEQALATYREGGETSSEAYALCDLAQLALDEGHPAEAETAARQSADQSRKAKVDDSEARAQAVLAEALFAQGKTQAAVKEIAVANTLAAQSQNLSLRLSVAITAASVQAASRDLPNQTRAIASLRQCLAEAAENHYASLQLEAALTLGEIEIESGQASAGRARLEALEKDATARGFGLMARKAATAKRKAATSA